MSATVWITGLPAAGKTTLAAAVRAELSAHGVVVCVLDGDELRRGLSSDLGLSRPDRAEQARRAAHVAALVAQAGVVVVVALVSPYVDDRQTAKELHDEKGIPFLEVWIDTPLAVCQQRDPKGLYARARKGELTGLTGVDEPYEPPTHPGLRIAGDGEDPQSAASKIAGMLGYRPGGPEVGSSLLRSR
jgi:bifunctional enzyme CysN/CysC